MSEEHEECSHLSGRMKSICDGSSGLPLAKVNAYRRLWKLPEVDAFHLVTAQQPRQGRPLESFGPGTELQKLLKARGVPSCQACKKAAAKMNRKRVVGCRRDFETIVAEIVPRAMDWVAKEKPWVSKLLPETVEEFGVTLVVKSLVNQAIANAEKTEASLQKLRDRVGRPLKTTFPTKPVLPVLFRKPRDWNWAAAFTIAPRKTSSWKTAVDSCRKAGWNPWLFVEPGVKVEGDRLVIRPETIADPIWKDRGADGKFGPHQNYMQTLKDLLKAEPEAEMILYCQDDAYFPPGAKEFLNSIDWTGIPLLSLWCPSGFGYESKIIGIADTPEARIIGAVAYAMPRSTAEMLVASAFMKSWKSKQPVIKRKTFDMATGEALVNAGLRAKYLTSSLVDHFEPTPSNSSIGNGAVKGFRASHRYVGNKASTDDIKSHFGCRPIHVVIPAYECLELTKTCLAAVMESNVETHICLVDNGSSEATVRVIKAILAGQPHTLIRNNTNRGFTAAIQQGIDCSNGRHVLLLNNDCRVEPDAIRSMTQRLTEHPMIAAVNPVTNDNGACSVIRNVNARKLREERSISDWETLPWFCTLIHRDALAVLNQLPTDEAVRSGLGVDDWWCDKIKSLGWRLRLDGNAFAEHDHSSTFQATGQDRKQLQREAKRWLMNTD